MNIQYKINQLLTALDIKLNMLYRINCFSSYSDTKGRYVKSYQVLKRTFKKKRNEEGKIEIIEKYIEKLKAYNKVDILKFLANEYEKGVMQLERKQRKNKKAKE